MLLYIIIFDYQPITEQLLNMSMANNHTKETNSTQSKQKKMKFVA